MNLIDKYNNKFESSIYILFNSLLDRGTFFILYVFLTHIVAKTEYGFIVSVFAFTNIIMAVFDFGLPFYIQRETASGNSIKLEINTILYIKSVSFLLFIPLPIMYFASTAEINIPLIIIISTINFSWGISSIFNAVLYGSDAYKKSSFYLLISRVVLFIAFIVLLPIKPGVEILLLPFILSFFVHFLLFKNHLKTRGIILFKGHLETSLVRKTFRSSFPMGLGVIFVLIYDRADILILQKISGLEIVAFYSVAYSLYRAMQIFSSMILVPKYSVFSKSFSQNRTLSRSELIHVSFSLLLLGLIIIFIMFVFPDFLIKLFYSSSYLPSSKVLRYLSIGFGGVLMNNFTGIILNSIRKEKVPAFTTGVGAVINIVLNIILITKIGIWGAVITTVITEYIVFIFQFGFLFYYKRRKVFVLN